MSGTTAKYAIPYTTLADSVASIAATMQNLAGRADLLLGESGQGSIAASAGVAFSTNIVLSRTYPGNASTPPGSGTVPPGIVIITPYTSFGAGVTCFYWVTAFTGTATTVTGFTINGISSSAVTRQFQWRFIPAL